MSTHTPEVSVLLPVHDAEGTLQAALASVATQTLANHEVIVVLNGVTDGSTAIAQEASRRDPRVRLVELPDAGLVPALNAGLEACRAPRVARLDADDRMLPERLAVQAAALEAQADWAVVGSRVRFETPGGASLSPDDDGPGAGMARYVRWVNDLATPAAIHAARFVDSPLVHPAVMFRTDAIRAAGGYHDGPFAEDYDLWLRLVHAGHTLGTVPETLTVWVDQPDRLTRTSPKCTSEALRALKHRWLVAGPLDGGRRHARLWGIGRYGRRHARELRALGVQIDDAVDVDPKRIGRHVLGDIPVVAPDDLGPPDGRLLLLTVAARGAREAMTRFVAKRGYSPERDYLALQ